MCDPITVIGAISAGVGALQGDAAARSADKQAKRARQSLEASKQEALGALGTGEEQDVATQVQLGRGLELQKRQGRNQGLTGTALVSATGRFTADVLAKDQARKDNLAARRAAIISGSAMPISSAIGQEGVAGRQFQAGLGGALFKGGLNALTGQFSSQTTGTPSVSGLPQQSGVGINSIGFNNPQQPTVGLGQLQL